jgi:Domain of unknown function (DUF5011)
MMKKNILAIALVACCLMMVTSCKKKESQDVSKTVKVTYPVIILKGNSAYSIATGSSYSDPGAKVYDDITKDTTQITGDASGVNTSAEGLYFVKYSATNANGFQTTVLRPVAVTNMPAAFDISGVYTRAENGVELNVTKVATGLFRTDNLGGSGSLSDPAYFVIKSDTTMDMPNQFVVEENNFINFTDVAFHMDPTDTTYEYKVDFSAVYGTSLRHFTHN